MTVTTLDQHHPTDSVDLEGLAARVRGRVLAAGTPDFTAAATPWNVSVPPAHVAAVEVVDAADVAAVLTWAAGHDLEVAVQATGHGSYVTGRRSVLVLTRLLDEVTVDAAAGTARVGAGVTWQRVIDAAAPHGLAGLVGSSPHVGVVGYVTGGGHGPISRTFGWASDRVVAFDVVTGDGVQRRATATENPALYWGLRGGKGALGIVTAVEIELVPVAEMYAGCLFVDGADAEQVLRAWADWAPTLPSEATTSVAVLRLPPLPSVPAPLAGRTVLAVRFAWVGDPADGERWVRPLTEIAPAVFGGFGVMPFTAVGMIHADPVDPMPARDAGRLLHSFPQEAVDVLLSLAGPGADCPQIVVEVRLLGGMLAAEPVHASALCHRGAAYSMAAIGIGVPPLVEAVTAHSDALFTALAPWVVGGRLPNFAPSADPREVALKYDGATFARLGTLADTYDPHGVLVAAAPFRGATPA